MKKYFFMMLCLVFFSGCGAGGGQIPPGSTLTILQGLSQFNDPDQSGAVHVDNVQHVIVQVTDKAGNPIQGAPISVKFTYTTAPDVTNLPYSRDQIVRARLSGGSFLNITNVTTSVGDTDSSGKLEWDIVFYSGGGLAYTGDLQVFSDAAGPQATTLTVTNNP